MLHVPLWQLIIHDLIKLHPTELQGYVRYYELKEIKSTDFYRAIHHHFRHCKHHWNYWTIQLDIDDPLEDYSVVCIPMPDWYIREMIADWAAAGYAKNGYLDIEEYYEKQKDKILLHAHTREAAERYIKKIVNDFRKLRQEISRST